MEDVGKMRAQSEGSCEILRGRVHSKTGGCKRQGGIGPDDLSALRQGSGILALFNQRRERPKANKTGGNVEKYHKPLHISRQIRQLERYSCQDIDYRP